MIFLDTNVLIYAFSKNVDNEKQKKLSQEILTQSVEDKTLVLSDIILCEFAYVSKKIEEDENAIEKNLQFLQKYTKQADISKKLIENLCKINAFKFSFDMHHACFCESLNCQKLFTFDKGFKKIQPLVKTKIEILTAP